MTARSPIHRATMPGPIDYGYLFDLAAVNGWKVALALLPDERHSLRMMEGDVILAGIIFPLADCRLDDIAETLFAELHKTGRV